MAPVSPDGRPEIAETVKRFEYPSTHRFGGRHLTNLWKSEKFLFIGPKCAHAPCVVTGRQHPPDGGMASTEAGRECETFGCSRDAKLQCPTCIKLGIQGSYFCSQVPSSSAHCPPWRSLEPRFGPCHGRAASCHARWTSLVKL